MTEHEKARAWRERLGLTPKQLADLSGYSAMSIYWMERGEAPSHGKAGDNAVRPISAWVWARYKAACAGVDATLSGRKFKW